jgi:mRNA-degrading endonuclease RelE of RelBE toxin-antitoxin system
MQFIESPIFTKIIHDYLSDDEYSALQWSLSTNPEAGQLIPKSGGLRKIRWAKEGTGKRGGLRIIYYYKKPTRGNLATHCLRQK